MMLLVDFASYWLRWAVEASWQLAVLVCIVAIVSRLLRSASPRLRHGLWLLVLIKAFLPPMLTSPWSLGRLAAGALNRVGGSITILSPISSPSGPFELDTTLVPATAAPLTTFTSLASNPVAVAIAIWAVGCLLFWAVIAWRCLRLRQLVHSATPIDEGPVRVVFEELALALRLTRVPDLLATDVVTSPFLCGIVRPAIVLPQKSLEGLGEGDLRAVLAHELVHFQRADTWIGWLQVLAQSLFWFHPLVWFANRQLRHERECVCDEAVLDLRQISPERYGESIVRVLTASHGRSPVGSLVGVLERGTKLQDRLEDIMSYEPSKRSFGWIPRLALAAMALLLWPMAAGSLPATNAAAQAEGAAPQIVSTIPAIGAKDASPNLSEIKITFDRDMSSGMSWTGGGPEFPPLDHSRKAEWTDKRTCVLPVKLAPGTYYRVGINSSNFRNFQSSDGVSVSPAVIYFTTTVEPNLEEKTRVPEIARLEPKNGANDVDPKTTELRVTFNIPMGEGMSWTGGGPMFPKIPDGKTPSWSKDGLTCTLPVALEPGHDYQLGLNSKSFNNFQSKSGVPLPPIVYKFRTRE